MTKLLLIFALTLDSNWCIGLGQHLIKFMAKTSIISHAVNVHQGSVCVLLQDKNSPYGRQPLIWEQQITISDWRWLHERQMWWRSHIQSRDWHHQQLTKCYSRAKPFGSGVRCSTYAYSRCSVGFHCDHRKIRIINHITIVSEPMISSFHEYSGTCFEWLSLDGDSVTYKVQTDASLTSWSQRFFRHKYCIRTVAYFCSNVVKYVSK